MHQRYNKRMIFRVQNKTLCFDVFDYGFAENPLVQDLVLRGHPIIFNVMTLAPFLQSLELEQSRITLQHKWSCISKVLVFKNGIILGGLYEIHGDGGEIVFADINEFFKPLLEVEFFTDLEVF